MNWTPEQQREHRRLWVEALRSGKYQQAHGQLRRGGAFCCLGVACQLSGLGEFAESGHKYVNDAEPDHYSLLPGFVRKYYGLSGESVTLSTLWRRNDAGFSFGELADIIASEPRDLIEEDEGGRS